MDNSTSGTVSIPLPVASSMISCRLRMPKKTPGRLGGSTEPRTGAYSENRYSAFSSSVTAPTDFFASPNSIDVWSA